MAIDSNAVKVTPTNDLFLRLDRIIKHVSKGLTRHTYSNPFLLGQEVNSTDNAIMADLSKMMDTMPDLEDRYGLHNKNIVRLRLVKSGNSYRSASFNEAKKILTIMCPRDY